MMPFHFSAFVEDMRFGDLPKAVRADVERFIAPKADHRFPHYGMVVKELIPKADPANLKAARANLKAMSPKTAGREVKLKQRRGEKFILVLNDRIVDGHHYLAKAERAGFTGSLDVMDLTTGRFQLGARPLEGSILQFDERRDLPGDLAKLMAGGGAAAAGAGVLRAGLASANAAQKVGRTADQATMAARSARRVTDGAVKTGKAVKRQLTTFPTLRRIGAVFKLSAKLRATQFAFVKPNVAADRYKKDIHEKDSARSGSHYVKSALGGAVIGALTRGKMARRQAAAIGAGVGIGAQTVARTGTGFTKDQFGDRSFTGKSIDKAVPTAGLIGAGVLAIRKLRGRMPVTLAARGTTKRQLLSAKLKEVHFFAKSYEHHSDREARDTTGQFRDSLGAAIRGETNYRNETVGLTDAPVINNAYRRAKTAVKIGNRVGALSRDAAGALAGQAKVDNRGRPLKREWEKSWFTNGIKNVVATGAVLGGAALLRKNPKLRGALVAAGARAAGRAGTVVKRGAQAVGTGINKATNVDRFFAAKVRAYFFDATASDWDVRDARGRSARVFAPGARPRERREKQWHEKVGNIRRVAVIGALTAAAGGAGLGYKLGKRLSKATPAPAAVIAEPPLKLIKFPQFAVTPPRAS